MINSRSLLHVSIVLSVSIGLGLLSNFYNPNGIWLSTPPADGSGTPSNAFGFGISIGAIISVYFYSTALLVRFVWQLIRKPRLKKTITPIILAIVVGVFLCIFSQFYFQ